MNTLGQRLRRLREERRWSQAELADLLGVTARAVGNWERDQNIPRNRLGALEQLFGVSLESGEPIKDSDPVVDAIENSALNRAERAELVSHYWRLLDGHENDEGRRLA